MSTFSRRTVLTAGTAAAIALALEACAPGSSKSASSTMAAVSTDIASAGNVTLTVWDQNTDGGINTAQAQLNAAFMKEHPNVKIERVTRSFADLKTTLKLALTSKTAPDVVQVNQGYPDMGSFVQGQLIRPVDDYAKLYGWDSYYPQQLLDLNRFTPDGKTWQSGNLYGVSQTGEMVGVYYNKKILTDLSLKAPRTISEFEALLPKIKAANILPIAYGDVEKSPGIHLYGIVQAALAGKQAVSDLVTGKSGAWTDDSSVKAAQTLVDWVDKGYLTGDANGISRDAALAAFTSGKAAFTITGTWQLATVDKALGANAGFLILAPDSSKTPVTTGGEGLAWGITAASKNPDVAAAYIDYVTNAKASQLLIDTGNLPTVPPKDWAPKQGTLTADVASSWKSVNESSGMVPYLDYSTPTFYDTLSAAVQELTAKKQTPNEFATTLQTDYAAFTGKK